MDRKAWRTKEGTELARQVFGRLVTGQSLDDLLLDDHGGRRDLRGFTMPARAARAAMAEDGSIPAEQVKRPEVSGTAFRDLDLSEATFDGLRFFDTRLDNCVFDGANFRDLKLWRTKVQDCSFRGARLVDAVLGALEDGETNAYTRVDFSNADLGRTACEYADFTDVDFSDAKLADIDFGSSTFTRCKFSGRLDRLIFWELPPNSERQTRNAMEDVDFSQAELHWVEFRGLRLDRVRLPANDQHIVVGNYRCVLERAVSRLTGNSPYAATFGHELHWAHPEREVGIWHRNQLGETEEEREAISTLLRQLAHDCAGDAEV